MRRAAKNRGGGGQGIQYLVSLQWPVVQLDFSDGMHMTEKSYMPQSARMRAQIQANTGKYRQIQANTGNFGRQRFSLHGVDLTKFDGGGARAPQDHPWTAQVLWKNCISVKLSAKCEAGYR